MKVFNFFVELMFYCMVQPCAIITQSSFFTVIENKDVKVEIFKENAAIQIIATNKSNHTIYIPINIYTYTFNDCFIIGLGPLSLAPYLDVNGLSIPIQMLSPNEKYIATKRISKGGNHKQKITIDYSLKKKSIYKSDGNLYIDGRNYKKHAITLEEFVSTDNQ